MRPSGFSVPRSNRILGRKPKSKSSTSSTGSRVSARRRWSVARKNQFAPRRRNRVKQDRNRAKPYQPIARRPRMDLCTTGGMEFGENWTDNQSDQSEPKSTSLAAAAHTSMKMATSAGRIDRAEQKER